MLFDVKRFDVNQNIGFKGVSRYCACMHTSEALPSFNSPKLAVLGASGRLGRLIRPFWGENPTIWQSRTPGNGFQKMNLLENHDNLVNLLSNVQTLICLAGVTPPATSIQFEDNIFIAQATLDAAKTANVRHVFLTSTAAVYGRPQGLLSECSSVAPISDYGQSKVSMERLAHNHKQASTVLRIGNVAGADAILGNWHPEMTLDILQDGKSPKRSYVGPKTLAKILQKLTEIENLPPVLNIASPGSIQMGDLLDEARLDYLKKPATERTIADVTLDTRLLEKYIPFQQEDSLPATMVAEWKEWMSIK